MFPNKNNENFTKMQTLKLLISLLFFYNSLFLFSQIKSTDNMGEVFNKKTKEFNTEVNFKKAQYFL